MIRFVWVLVVSYVALGAGLFYSLAIESTALFVATATLLVLVATPQWYLLSRYNRRTRGRDEVPRNRT